MNFLGFNLKNLKLCQSFYIVLYPLFQLTVKSPSDNAVEVHRAMETKFIRNFAYRIVSHYSKSRLAKLVQPSISKFTPPEFLVFNILFARLKNLATSGDLCEFSVCYYHGQFKPERWKAGLATWNREPNSYDEMKMNPLNYVTFTPLLLNFGIYVIHTSFSKYLS